jgi:hypothetical protein
LNVIGTVGGAVAPGAGLVGSSLAKGRISMEMRVLNGKGELLGAVADTEQDVTSLANVNDYTRLGHIKRRIDEWADQFAELLTTPPDHLVEDSPGFRLLPW